jgi:diamine N-acetyltransferase
MIDGVIGEPSPHSPDAADTHTMELPPPPTVVFDVVSRDNYRDALSLRVTPEQEALVGTVAEAIVDVAYGTTPAVAYVIRAEHRHADAVGFFVRTIDPDGDTLQIHRLQIDRGHQRKGYGRAAVDALEQMARDCRLKWIETRVPIRATDACAFYDKMGFMLVPGITPDCDQWLAVKRIT